MIHLHGERVESVELLLVAQLGHELHRHALAVEVTVEVKQVHFQQRLANFVDRGPHAQASYAGPAALALAQPDAHSKDAVHRADALLQVDVGGGITQRAAELLAPTLISVDTLRAATTVQFPELDGVLPGVGRFRPLDWGLGFEIRDGKAPHWTGRTNSAETFGHFGGTGTFLWVDPVAAVAGVGLTDRDFGPWALDAWPALSDAALAELAGLADRAG